MDAYRKRIIAAGASGRQVDNLETARRVLELAQRTADEAIEAARGVADQTLGVAPNETEAILAKALTPSGADYRRRGGQGHGPGA